MVLKSIALCSRSLEFIAHDNWPMPLPAMAWRGHLLTGFSRLEGLALDYETASNEDLFSLLAACYPELGLATLARLREKLLGLGMDSAPLFSIYRLRMNQSLDQLCSCLTRLPMKVQIWIDERELGPRELNVLLNFDDLAVFTPVLEEIANRPLGRQIGAKILETAGELLLLGTELPPLPSRAVDRDGRAWLELLISLRQPLVHCEDDQRRRQIQEFHWPSQVKAQWQRQGDESGVEIKFTAHSAADWIRRLNDLESLKEKLAKSSVWT